MGGFRAQFLWVVVLCLVMVSFGAEAKGKKLVDVKKIEVREMRQGRINLKTNSGGVSQTAAQNIWKMITIRYKTNEKWISPLEFKFYVQLGNGKKAVIGVGRSSYLDVGEGNNHYAVAYIRPNTLKRYGDLTKAVIEIWYQDELLAVEHFPSKSQKEWWKATTLETGLVVNAHETPFYYQGPDAGETLETIHFEK